MIVREDTLVEGVSKVCFGDAFVYVFPRITQGCLLNADAARAVFCVSYLFFLRTGYEY